jgi:hypothetical protein
MLPKWMLTGFNSNASNGTKFFFNITRLGSDKETHKHAKIKPISENAVSPRRNFDPNRSPRGLFAF